MNVTKWMKSFFSTRKNALSMYRRGMLKAKTRDSGGAIEDYTSAINMLDAPTDVISMARFNRALVYVARGEHSKGTADLDVVISMAGAPSKVRAMAKQKLIRMRLRKNEPSGNRHTDDE